jgi:hypothetical protein
VSAAIELLAAFAIGLFGAVSWAVAVRAGVRYLTTRKGRYRTRSKLGVQNRFTMTTHQYAKSLGSSDLTVINKVFMRPTSRIIGRQHTHHNAAGPVSMHLSRKVRSAGRSARR